MRKMFQNASSLKPFGQLKPNCPRMIIGRSSTNFMFFYCGGGHLGFPIGIKNRIFVEDLPIIIPGQFDPMGKMFQNASSLKLLGQLKPNCPGMIIGRSSTKFLFFMPIGNPRWLLSEQKTLKL
jgi:hypothetical protein